MPTLTLFVYESSPVHYYFKSYEVELIIFPKDVVDIHEQKYVEKRDTCRKSNVTNTMQFFPAVISALSFASRITVYCVRDIYVSINEYFTLFVDLWLYANVCEYQKQQVEFDTEQKRQQNKHKCQKLLFYEHKQFFVCVSSSHFISYHIVFG